MTGGEVATIFELVPILNCWDELVQSIYAMSLMFSLSMTTNLVVSKPIILQTMRQVKKKRRSIVCFIFLSATLQILKDASVDYIELFLKWVES